MRTHLRPVVWSLVALPLLAGCSSGGGGGGVVLGAGSFSLVFESVVDDGLVDYPPSLGHVARLDLREASGAWEALVTPRWGAPRAFGVAVTDTEITLTGDATIGGSGYGAATDDWYSIVLRSDADGAPTSFSATGAQSVDYGDYFDAGSLSAEGTVGPDALAPEVDFAEQPVFHAAAPAMPWDGARVRVAEGVAEAGFAAGLSVTPAGGSALPAVWTTGAPGAETWAGVTLASAAWPWLSIADGTTLTIRATSAVDPSGNAAVAFEAAMEIFALPAELPAHHFDAGQTLAPWGAVTRLDSASGACELGGCLSFGPYEVSDCGGDLVGVAGRLAASQLPGLHVRYRVEMGVEPDAWLPVPASVWLVSPTGERSRTAMAVSATDFVQAGAVWSTSWSDLVVDASAFSGDTMGIAIHAGEVPGGCGYGLPMPTYQMTLFVDAITPE